MTCHKADSIACVRLSKEWDAGFVLSIFSQALIQLNAVSQHAAGPLPTHSAV
jgi:hypothetical protein